VKNNIVVNGSIDEELKLLAKQLIAFATLRMASFEHYVRFSTGKPLNQEAFNLMKSDLEKYN